MKVPAHVARVLGPRGVMIVLSIPGWFLLGLGTLEGHAGKPDGAPHLLLPVEFRGWVLWIIPAVVCTALLFVRGEWGQRACAAALTLGPVVRAFSYGYAWFAWVASGGESGSPAGYYTSAPWLILTFWVAAIMYAPDDWSYLHHSHQGRDGGRRDNPAPQ